MKTADAIIVGGSVAGLAAGMQLARAGMRPVIMEQSLCFGHKLCAAMISNPFLGYSLDYFADEPGTVGGVSSALLMNIGRARLKLGRESRLAGLRKSADFLLLDRERFEQEMAARAGAAADDGSG